MTDKVYHIAKRRMSREWLIIHGNIPADRISESWQSLPPDQQSQYRIIDGETMEEVSTL